MGATSVVYVSNAGDGTIAQYTLMADGRLEPGPRRFAGALAMPMAVSPDRLRLRVALRSRPYRVLSYAIDPRDGALTPQGDAPLAESMVYLVHDRTGHWLLGASFGGHQVSVNPVSADGRVDAPSQVVPTGLNAHAIVVDRSNRFVFVPHLGSDELFVFRFDADRGALAPNAPATLPFARGTGPRHLALSADNRFLYVLGELTGTVTTLSLDPQTGRVSVIDAVSALPPDTPLKPGQPRRPADQPGGEDRDTSKDIWASDLHLSPDGRFLYVAERTGSTISRLRIDAGNGRLGRPSSTATATQPRSFAIDPSGRFLVAAGERDSSIHVHAIHETTGDLTLVGQAPAGRGANWVSIVPLDPGAL